MDKPTIFFSHSSKDKDLILPIKNKIENITANVIDIFMSSDGQSIPFGHNWVHKIEEGLNRTQIMFVFVTPTSINSSWIYFETGFAYSKNVQVIPVGLGVNIGSLNPPLNLLQGFDITSYESLNNFISIINKKFELSFKESFNLEDYNNILNISSAQSQAYNLSKIFKYAKTEIGHYIEDNENEKKKKANKYFSDLKEYLDNNGIQYSLYEPRPNYANRTKTILVSGIRIDVSGYENDIATRINKNCEISISVSTINFVESFELLKKILLLAEFDLKNIYLHFYFNIEYDCLNRKIEISSLISQCIDKFTCNKDSLNLYNYLDKNIKFGIIDVGEYGKNEPKYVLGLVFDTENTTAENIKELVRELEQCKLIYRKSN